MDFFTNSWGANLHRDPSDYINSSTVNRGNALEMARDLADNPEACEELLKVIAEMASPGDTEWQAAGLAAANTAAGIGPVIIEKIDEVINTLTEDGASPGQKQDAIVNILNGLDDVTGIADNLVKLFEGTPATYEGGYGNGIGSYASQTDIAGSALALIVADYQKHGGSVSLSSYIDELTSAGGDLGDITSDSALDAVKSQNPYIYVAYSLLKSCGSGIVGDLMDGLDIGD
jgi:hypothetical protein